jgi:hypothetical protein
MLLNKLWNQFEWIFIYDTLNLEILKFLKLLGKDIFSYCCMLTKVWKKLLMNDDYGNYT